MKPLRLAIVGAGLIGGVVARAAANADGVVVAAVASRRPEQAAAFAAEHGIAACYADLAPLLASRSVDAVYVATPTDAKEAVALAAIAAGKHVLVDKPFASASSLNRILGACATRGVAFMDATHFTHHPRTLRLTRELDELIGGTRLVQANFLFPFSDRTNIRFNPCKEPFGALGDMGWYVMRAVAEYMPDAGRPEQLLISARREPATGGILGATGIMLFAAQRRVVFNLGYDAEVCAMDLELVGPRGLVHLDDFVLDFHSSFAFDNPHHLVGFTLRQGMMVPPHGTVDTPSSAPQAQLMLEAFAGLAMDPLGPEARRLRDLSLATQRLLDDVCGAVRSTSSSIAGETLVQHDAN